MRIAEDEGWFGVTALASENSRPYGPLAGVAEQVVAGDRAALDSLGVRARSVLATLTPLAAPAEPLDRPLTRHEAIGAIRRLLIAAAGGAHVVLVIDDAHLADEASLDLLLNLGAAGPSQTQILVVLAYRAEQAPEALTRGVARLGRGGRAVEIDLEPLDHEDAAALVAAGASTPRSPEVVERIVELAQGNPFLTIEVARSPVAGVPSLVPTARDAVVARLVDFDAQTTDALGRLALAGDSLDAASVVVLTGSKESEALTLLDEALRTGVLVVAESRYRFRHDLVRQALIDRVAPHQRLVIHREMAERLSEAAAPPGLIARQWQEAGEPDEAGEWLLAAAREALALGAYGDALVQLDPLLEHQPEHADALRLRAEALDARGDAGAPAAYARAAEVIGGQTAQELKAMQALATVKLGDPETALKVLEKIQPTTVEGRLAEALAHCGSAALGFADPEIGSAKAAEARRLALQTGDSNSLVIASWANAAAAHARGDLRSSVLDDLHDTQSLPEPGGQCLRWAALHHPAVALRRPSIPRRDRVHEQLCRGGRSARSGPRPRLCGDPAG